MRVTHRTDRTGTSRAYTPQELDRLHQVEADLARRLAARRRRERLAAERDEDFDRGLAAARAALAAAVQDEAEELSRKAFPGERSELEGPP